MIAPRLGQVLYGTAFCVVLPWLLVLWSRNVAALVHWPLPFGRGVGALVAAAGAAWMLAAMRELWQRGGGLPMNAYPPPRLCTAGPYRWHAHPIYFGFVLLCLGVATATGSAAATYVVTPFVAAAALALVLGYEAPALERRFTGATARLTLLSLPTGDRPVTLRDRFAVLLSVLLPWLAIFLWCVALGPPRDALAPWLPGEREWPVWAATYPIYASAYLVVGLAPFWARDALALASFARAGRAAIVLHTFLYLVVPLSVVPKGVSEDGWLAGLLAFESQHSATGAGAFPSFHVTWAVLAALLAMRSFPRFRAVAALWALAVAVSCVTTGMHAVVDVVAGAVTALLVARRMAVWEALRSSAERVANSLRYWTFGPVRVFVHAPYAGVSAALVVFTTGRFAGPGALPEVLALAGAALVGAALWAQWAEGGSVSLRPFGYYGSALGALAALGVFAVFGGDPWPLAGGLAVAAPFAQAIGRLRCLAQGCCHGRPAAPQVGIVCTAPLARVVRLAGLGGVPVHATQLYSILWNVTCGLALLRCAHFGQPPSVVAGLYLITNGLGRFVEEVYRGEPQSRRWAGLGEYQHYSIVSVALGALATCAVSEWPARAPSSLGLVLASLLFGAFVALAMGVDFPRSNRRFARLLR